MLNNNLIGSTLSRIKKILTRDEFRLWYSWSVYGIFSVLLDALALVLILPVINILTSNQNIVLHRFWGPLYTFSGAPHVNQFLLYILIIVLTFYVIKTWIGIFITARQAKASHTIAGNLSQRVFMKHFKQDFLQIRKKEISQTITNIQFLPSHFATGLLIPASILISELVLMIVIVTGTLLLKPLLFLLLSLTLIPMMWLVYRWLRRKMNSIGESRNTFSIEAHQALTETFSMWEEITLFRKIKSFENKYIKNYHGVNANDAQLVKYTSIPFRLVEITALAGITLILLFSMTFGVGDYQLTYLMSLYTVAAFRLIPSINRITQSMLKLKNYQYALKTMEEWGGAETDKEVNMDRIEFDSIKIQSLQFKYESSDIPALKLKEMELKRGQMIGVKGASGSGKTTLIHILCGFIKPQQGRVWVNDKETDFDFFQKLQTQIGLVRQETVLINGGMEANICLNEEGVEIDAERLNTLIQNLSLEGVKPGSDFLGDRQVGERGQQISGGQRQRIGIGRALYHHPGLLILDESTNALDKETEKKVMHLIQEMAKKENMAVLIISHHQEVLKHCDHIYELESYDRI